MGGAVGGAAAAILQAYTTAKAAMVQVPVCETNRVVAGRLRRDQFIGQNTPVIIALDMEYFDLFWPTTRRTWAATRAS